MDKQNKTKPHKRPRKFYSTAFKHQVISEYLTTGCTKQEIFLKYTGQSERGHFLRWLRLLGYGEKLQGLRVNIASKFEKMQKKQKPQKTSEFNEQTFENLQLKKRVAELEKQLKEAELKAIAFSTMVDIAEDMFKIPIRKKLNTKP